MRYKDTTHEAFEYNFSRLSRFNYDNLSTTDCLFFSFVLWRAKGKKFAEFPLSQATIERETGLKRRSVNSAQTIFSDLGIIKTRVEGSPQTTYYTVSLEAIWDNIDFIYRELSEENRSILLEAYREMSRLSQK